MIWDIMSEAEFKKRLAYWLIDNDKAALIPYGSDRDEYAESFRLPDFEYTHTQSATDENGDLISLMKSSIHLKAWETRNGHEPCSFEFYLVLKTMTDCPEVEPFPMGYIIAD